MFPAFLSARSRLRLHAGLVNEDKNAVAESVPRPCKKRRRLLRMTVNLIIKCSENCARQAVRYGKEQMISEQELEWSVATIAP